MVRTSKNGDILKKGNVILVEGNIEREGSCLARSIRVVQQPQ